MNKMMTAILFSAFFGGVQAGTITNSTDNLFNIKPRCESPSEQKKTVFLVDYTVENKSALVGALKSVESAINGIYNSDQKEYLLNHKFEYAIIDSNGEHSAEWVIITSKEFGNRFSRLRNSLVDLNTKIEKSIQSIRANKKKYNSTLLLEQISSYGRRLHDCDNLIVLSDLMVVDEANNFEKGKFSNPVDLELKKGDVSLYRIERTGLSLINIKKLESWWEQALNGGSAFSKYAKTKPEIKRRKSSYFVSMMSL